MNRNPRQFTVAELLIWATVVEVWVAMMKWSGEAWPFVAGYGLFILGLYLDRRFLIRISSATAFLIILALIGAGILLGLMFPAIR